MSFNITKTPSLIELTRQDDYQENESFNHRSPTKNLKNEFDCSLQNISELSSPYYLNNLFRKSPTISLNQCSLDEKNNIEILKMNEPLTKVESNLFSCQKETSFESDVRLSLDVNETSDICLNNQSSANTIISLSPAAQLLGNKAQPSCSQIIRYSPGKESWISIEQICRICHEGDALETFISPCRCSGSMAVVHKSCMEKWLSNSSQHEKCELCNSTIFVIRKPKSIREYIMEAESGEIRSAMFSDILCLIILTPIILWGSYTCIKGILDYLPNETLYSQNILIDSDNTNGEQIKFEKIETELKKTAGVIAGLVIICVVLILVYVGWLIIAFRYHIKAWMDWRKKNHRIRLVENV